MTVIEDGVNRDVLAFLRARGRPGTGSEYDLDGWELHTHPDLVERLAQIARSRQAVIPLYGVVALEQKGVIVVVALGTSHLLFRLTAAPEGVEAAAPIEPLCGNGWHPVSAWQSQLHSDEGLLRLIALVKEARRHGNTLAPR